MNNKPAFLGQDIKYFAKQFKDILEPCYDTPIEDSVAILSYNLDLINQMSVVDGIMEEFVKKSGQDMSIQVDTLNRKMNNWENIQDKSIIKQGIYRFFINIKKHKIQTEIQQKKIDEYTKNQIEDQDLLVFIQQVIQNDQKDEQVIYSAVRAFKIIIQFNETNKLQGKQGLPQLNFKKLKEKNEEFIEKWDNLINSLLITLSNTKKVYDSEDNLKNRIIEILIILANLSKKIQSTCIEYGAIRICLNLLENNEITFINAKGTLTLIRDLCIYDQRAADLLGRHDVEQYLLKMLIRYRESVLIQNLVSDILERLIHGSEIDIDTFENNIKQAERILQIYLQNQNINSTNNEPFRLQRSQTVLQSLDDESVEKALHNLEIIRFYSLMQFFTRKFVEINFHELLYKIMQKQIDIDFDHLESDEILIHNQILANTIIVTNKILTLPETNGFNQYDNIPFQVAEELLPKIIFILKQKKENREIIYHTLQSLYILSTNDTTKKNSVQYSVKCKVTQDLINLNQTYFLDKQIKKLINDLIFIFAKQFDEAALNLKDNNMVQDILSNLQNNNSTESQEDRETNLQYLNNLADIPKTAESIMKENGIQYLLKQLVLQNKESLKQNSNKKEYFNDDNLEEKIYDLITDYINEIKLNQNYNFDILEEFKQEQTNENESNVIEIIRKLLSDEEQFDKFMTEDIVKEILRYIRMNVEDRDKTISALRLLNNCVQNPKTLDFVNKNKGVETVFLALNTHPTDKDILELSGEILAACDAENLAKEVKAQYDDLGDDFDIKDEESLEGIRQANIYLSNLCTAIPEDEDSEELIEENKKVLTNVQKFMHKDTTKDFIASNLLLIGRLANQGEPTKQLIRQSEIPQKIVEQVILNPELIDIQLSGKIPEFALDALVGMITGGSDVIPQLDINTGEQIIYETPEMILEYIYPLNEILIQQDYAAFHNIVELIDINQIKHIDTIQKACLLVSRCIECEQSFIDQVLQQKGDKKVIQIFEGLCRLEKNNPVKQMAFIKVSQLLGVLASCSEQFFQELCQNDLVMQVIQETLLNIKIQPELINNLKNMDTLNAVIIFIKYLSKAPHPKDTFVISTTPITLLKIAIRMIDLKSETYNDSVYLSLILREVMQTLVYMVSDSKISIELFKNNLIRILINCSKNMFDEQTKPEEEDLQPDTIDEIYGENDPMERAMETLYWVIEICCQTLFNSEIGAITYKDEFKFVQYVTNQQIKPFIVTKMLLSLQKLIVSYTEEEQYSFEEEKQYIYLNKQKFKNDVKIIIKTLSQKYPNIPIINDLIKSIQSTEPLILKDQQELKSIRDKIFNLQEEQQLFEKEIIEQSQIILQKQISTNSDLEVNNQPNENDIQNNEQNQQNTQNNLQQSQVQQDISKIKQNYENVLHEEDSRKKFLQKQFTRQNTIVNFKYLRDIQTDSESSDDETREVLGKLMKSENISPKKKFKKKSEDISNEISKQNSIKSQIQKQESIKKEQQQKDINQLNISNADPKVIMQTVNKIYHELNQFYNQVIQNQKNIYEPKVFFIIQLIKYVESYVKDNSTALTIHNLQITNIILQLTQNQVQLGYECTNAICHCIQHISQFTESIQKSEKPLNFMEPLIKFIQQNLEVTEYKETVIFAMEAVKNTCKFQVKKFIELKGLSLLKKIIQTQQNNLDLLCVTAVMIDKLATNEKTCLVIIPIDSLDNLADLYKKYSQNEKFLLNFALVIGTICRSPHLQQKMGLEGFHIYIIQGIKDYPTNITLITNSFYALSGLSYTNIPNSNAIVQQDIFVISKIYISDYEEKHTIIETICSMYSNLTFKNDKNKEAIGNYGIIEQLIELAKLYCSKQDMKTKTIKQIFRALGNSCLFLKNTEIAIKKQFCEVSIKLIQEKLQYIEQGDIMRYAIDVISNLASHKDELNNQNTGKMLQQGVVDCIINTLKKNLLNVEVLNSCVDAIDGLIQNKLINVVVAEKDSVNILIKVLRSQDMSSILVIKCSRILANLSLVKTNIVQLVNQQLPLTLQEILKNQKKPQPKLILYCFKILNRLCGDPQKVQIQKSGIIEGLGLAVIHQKIDKDSIENIILLLRNLSTQTINIPVISNHALLNVIQRTLQMRNNADIVYSTLQLMNLIMNFDNQFCKTITYHGGLELILSTLRDQNPITNIIDLSLKALKTICSVNEELRYYCDKQQSEQTVKFLSKNSKGQTQQLAQQVLFALYNKKQSSHQLQTQQSIKQIKKPELNQDTYKFLIQGFEGKYYSKDGSTKTCRLQLSQNLSYFEAVRIKNKEIKCRINVTDISDYKFNYEPDQKTWEFSYFSKGGGLFQHKPNPDKCISIFGQVVNDSIMCINLELGETFSKKLVEKHFLIFIEYLQLLDAYQKQQTI